MSGELLITLGGLQERIIQLEKAIVQTLSTIEATAKLAATLSGNAAEGERSLRKRLEDVEADIAKNAEAIAECSRKGHTHGYEAGIIPGKPGETTPDDNHDQPELVNSPFADGRYVDGKWVKS